MPTPRHGPCTWGRLMQLVKARRLILIFSTVFWAVTVGASLGMLWEYSASPGAEGDPPQVWPADSKLPAPSGSPVLVMIAHPQCPCSRASIGELARLMAEAPVEISATVLFVKPAGADQAWSETDLWRKAAAIPGVRVLSDDDALEARRFGAATSGQTVVYDGEGRLQFSGGITASRGHAGDNAGLSAILSLLARPVAHLANTPVFGCSLFSPKAACQQGAMLCRR